MFSNKFIANLLMNPPVKGFRNRLAFGKVADKSLVSWFFGSQCTIILAAPVITC